MITDKGISTQIESVKLETTYTTLSEKIFKDALEQMKSKYDVVNNDLPEHYGNTPEERMKKHLEYLEKGLEIINKNQ
jgi:hypothetical protein